MQIFNENICKQYPQDEWVVANDERTLNPSCCRSTGTSCNA